MTVDMPTVHEIDPTLDFLQSFNMSTSSSSSSTNSFGNQNEGLRDDDDDDLEPPTSNPSHVAAGSPTFHSLQTFGQMLKGRKDFSGQTEAEFDAFCLVRLFNPHRRSQRK